MSTSNYTIRAKPYRTLLLPCLSSIILLIFFIFFTQFFLKYLAIIIIIWILFAAIASFGPYIIRQRKEKKRIIENRCAYCDHPNPPGLKNCEKCEYPLTDTYEH